MIKIELNKDMCDEIDKFVATMVKEVDFRPNFLIIQKNEAQEKFKKMLLKVNMQNSDFISIYRALSMKVTKLTLIYTNVENGMTEILKLPIEAPHTRLKLNHLL